MQTEEDIRKSWDELIEHKKSLPYFRTKCWRLTAEAKRYIKLLEGWRDEEIEATRKH